MMNAILPGFILAGFIMGTLMLISFLVVFFAWRIHEVAGYRITFSKFRFDSFIYRQGRWRNFTSAVGFVFGAVAITSFSLLHDLHFSTLAIILGITWGSVLSVLIRRVFAWKKAGYSVVLFGAAIAFVGFLTFQLAPVFPGVLGLICFLFWCIDGVRGKSIMTDIFDDRHSRIRGMEDCVSQPPKETKHIKIVSAIMLILFIGLIAWQFYRVFSIWMGQ